MFIPDGDQIICKTYMTRVEGENTRLRHYLARLHRKTLCYSKSVEMLKHSIRLVIHYLKFWEVPVPYPSYHFNRALAEANRVAKTSLDPTNHISIQQRLIILCRSHSWCLRERRWHLQSVFLDLMTHFFRPNPFFWGGSAVVSRILSSARSFTLLIRLAPIRWRKWTNSDGSNGSSVLYVDWPIK